MSQIVTCPPVGCKTILSSACTFYYGPSLMASGVSTNDSVEVIIQKLDEKLNNTGGINLNTVTNYRSSFEIVDGKVYAGYILNNNIIITRTLDGILENAINLTNLDADWINRLNLIYN